MHSWNDPHVKESARSLMRALYTTAGMFLGFFVFYHISNALYVSHLSEQQRTAFEQGIAQEKSYLKEQGDAVAADPVLHEYLEEGSREQILTFIQEERAARSIGLMSVANSEGVIIGRTFSPGKYGDNVFLTAPAGRAVSKGLSVESIERTGFGDQIFMTTVRPVLRQGEMVGAVFANHLLDDAYAVRFKQAYLSPRAEVAFYTKESGIYGQSFSDAEIHTLVSSYFNEGSEWVRDGVSGKTVSFGDGTSYLVENVVFQGLEQSPGGALIFIPREDFSDLANGIATALVLLVFLFLTIRHHVRTRGEERGWRYIVLVICFSIPVVALAYFALSAHHLGRLQLTHVPYALYNSTLRLQPEWGIFNVGIEQNFLIMVDSGDESINAVEVEIYFDPRLVSVRTVDTSNSACSYFIENTVDQEEGIIRVRCILIDAPTDVHSFSIGSIVATPLVPGGFTFTFDSKETHVLANDGLGTNVLRASQDASYRADNFKNLLGQGTTTEEGRSFVVFSPTHPNEIRWYGEDTATFVWLGEEGNVYQYAFDSSPTPSLTAKWHPVEENRIDIPIPGDGIFYFHLQSVSGGPIVNYRVQADMTPPTILELKMSHEKVFVGDVVRFSFDAEDPRSGVQRNYYIDFGDHLFLPAGSQLYVPFLEAGEQTIVLRVYDGAGNYAEERRTIVVEQR